MKKQDSFSIAKITRPKLSGISPRDRLFRQLDKARKKPVIWVGAPAGAGKTTLVASWLDERKLPSLWYQVDAGDGDLASFFYYMGLAARKAAPRVKKPLPLLTPEYLQSIPVFTRRYFEELFRRLKTPALLVLDNYQDAPLVSGFHEMVAHALDTVPEGINVIILSRTGPAFATREVPGEQPTPAHRVGGRSLYPRGIGRTAESTGAGKAGQRCGSPAA